MTSSATSSASGSYDWGQSQVQKMYQSPYARPSDAVAATAERKRLTESRSEREDKDAKDASTTTASASRKASGGKLACLGMGSTINGTGCHAGDQQGFSLYQQQGLQQSGLQQPGLQKH